jgi:hypothetical protein
MIKHPDSTSARTKPVSKP